MLLLKKENGTRRGESDLSISGKKKKHEIGRRLFESVFRVFV